MRALITYESIHHGNTEKVARVIAEVLEAKLVKPEEPDTNTVLFVLVPFGKHHKY